MTDDVPIIDIGGDPDAVATGLDVVCREVGFFQIIGHGVPDDVADAAWQAATSFFDLPLADRMAVVKPHPNHPYGYVPNALEVLARSLDEGGAPDLKEIFNVGPVDPLGRPYVDDDEVEAFSPNVWPAALPEMQATFEPYFREMLALAGRLMNLFARGLGLPADHFESFIDESPSAMRAINYPDQPEPPAPGQLRAGAHSDYGTLTILRQDAAPGGLEVQSPHDGRWIPIPSVPGAFVVNVGDLLARWTNDRWVSTMHRVVNPDPADAPTSRRQSMPFFHNANFHARVECLPTCLAPGEAPRYEPVLAGPHLMGKFRKTVV